MTGAGPVQERGERPPPPPPPEPFVPLGEAPITDAGFPAWGAGSLAPIGRRALGRLIDTIVVMIPFAVLAAQYVTISGDKVDVAKLPGWFGVAWQATAVVYETLLLTWRGQTLGKMAAGTRVVGPEGAKPHWWQAALRIGIPSLAFLIPYFGGGILAAAIYLTAIWHPFRQGWHDRAAGTVVVATR
jgi:uncharacterized RDD family membrane protein YckC